MKFYSEFKKKGILIFVTIPIHNPGGHVTWNKPNVHKDEYCMILHIKYMESKNVKLIKIENRIVVTRSGGWGGKRHGETLLTG
jgi:hypothetical protein